MQIRSALARDGAFTLIELLIVINVVGILILIAVPSYLQFKDRAAKAAAKGNVREAVTAINSYYEDNGTYVGMTPAALGTYNRSLPALTIKTAKTTTYCVSSQVGNWIAYRAGPSAAITTAAC